MEKKQTYGAVTTKQGDYMSEQGIQNEIQVTRSEHRIASATAQSVSIDNLTMAAVATNQNIYFTPGIIANAINEKPQMSDIQGSHSWRGSCIVNM